MRKVLCSLVAVVTVSGIVGMGCAAGEDPVDEHILVKEGGQMVAVDPESIQLKSTEPTVSQSYSASSEESDLTDTCTVTCISSTQCQCTGSLSCCIAGCSALCF